MTSILRKAIACNGTNSACIDASNEVWVWGASRTGLLGRKQEQNQTYPKRLPLTTGNKVEEEIKLRDIFMRDDEPMVYEVHEIAMGANHMLAVATDKMAKKNVDRLEYASNILRQLREHLLNHAINIRREQKTKEMDYSRPSEKVLIEIALADYFSADEADFPRGKWSTFIHILFNEIGLVYDKEMKKILTSLQQDLSDGPTYTLINLRSVRNQVLGQMKPEKVVFGWGLKDARLCVDHDNEEGGPRKRMDQLEYEDLYLPTTLLGMFTKLKVKTVACGDSFSLALTERGTVYSWGIGQNGSLGLGDTVLQAATPQKVEFFYPRMTVFLDNRASMITRIKIEAIDCGQSHCLAMTDTGSIFSWGCGLNGRLGHGDEIGSSFPEQIRAIGHIKVESIACGDAHSAAITVDGELYMWGDSKHGKLGMAQVVNVDKEIPTLVCFFAGKIVRHVFLGLNNSFCITGSNETYAWGSSKNGKFGIPRSSEWLVDSPIKMYLPGTTNVYIVAAGPFHTLCLNKDGDLYVFGTSNEGKLGIFRLGERMHAMGRSGDGTGYYMIDWPWKLTEEVPRKWAISQDGRDIYQLYPYFQNTLTTTGVLRNDQPERHIVQAVCGEYNTYLLYQNGSVFCCGSNSSWQCTKIEAMENDKDECVDEFFLRVTQEEQNQINEEKKDMNNLKQDQQQEPEEKRKINVKDINIDIPVIPAAVRNLVAGIQNKRPVRKFTEAMIIDKMSISKIYVKQISAGENHALATATIGIVFGWGDNNYGQLGLGRPIGVGEQEHEAKIIRAINDQRIVMTAAGKAHSLFLSEEGRVYACGFSEFGELGVPLIQVQKNMNQKQAIVMKCKPQPVQIFELEHVRFIAAGKNHSLAINSETNMGNTDSNLYTWGLSAFGQLGHYDVKNQYNLTEPKLVDFLQEDGNKVKIAFASCSPKHTLCVDSKGELWYFGDKQSVGIADKTNKYQFKPSRLVASNHSKYSHHESKFRFVAAGVNNNMVLTQRNGLVYSFGQLVTGLENFQEDDEAGDDSEESINLSDNLDQELLLAQQNVVAETFFREQIIDLSKGEDDADMSYIAVGLNHQIAISGKDSMPYVWAQNEKGNDYGQLGLLDDEEEMRIAHRIAEEENLKLPEDRKKSPEEIKALLQQPDLSLKEMMSPIVPRRVNRFVEKETKKLQIEQARQMALASKSDNQAKIGGIEDGSDNEDADKEASLDEEEAEADVIEKSYRYWLQYNLHQTISEKIKTQDLLKKDDMVLNDFLLTINDFHAKLRGRTDALRNMISLSQDALVSRVMDFPTPITPNKMGKNQIPKILIRNKKILEFILTYLQSHPCYIITWIKKLNYMAESSKIKPFIYRVFGRREIKDNPRVINTLVIIAKHVFDEELRLGSLKSTTSLGAASGPFRAIFNIILESQSQNHNFNREIMQLMVFKMRDMCLMTKDPEHPKFALLEQEDLKQIMIEMMAYVYEKMRTNDSDNIFNPIKGKEAKSLSLQVLSLLNYVFKRLQEKAKEKLGINDDEKDPLEDEEDNEQDDDEEEEEAKDSDEEVEKDPNTYKSILIEWIFPYMQTMLFEFLLKQIEDVNFEIIKFHIWDIKREVNNNMYVEKKSKEGNEAEDEDDDDEQNEDAVIVKEPRKDVFEKFFEKQYFVQIAQMLKRYFQASFLDLMEEERACYEKFLSKGYDKDQDPIDAKNGVMKTPEETNFREEIADVMFIEPRFKPINFDYLLLSQLFVTSMMPADPVMSITINDFLFIYNTLVEQKTVQWIDDPDGDFIDPVKKLQAQLGDNSITLDAEDQAIGKRQLNLRIKCRFLINHRQIVNCNTCNSPVIDTMIPRFQDRQEGRSWTCRNDKVSNGPERSRCVNCGYNIPTDQTDNLRHSPFPRFKRLEELEELEEDETPDDEDEFAQEIDEPMRKLLKQKEKRTINLLTHVLRDLPTVEKNSELTFLQTLNIQIDLLDEKYGRKYDPIIKIRFEKMKNEIEKFLQTKVDVIDRYIRRLKGGAEAHSEAAVGEKIFLRKLLTKATRKLRIKREHTKQQIDYDSGLIQIKLQAGQIFAQSMSVIDELDRLFFNTWTGLSSPFLTTQMRQVGDFTLLQENLQNDPQLAMDTRHIIWAGNLAKKNIKQQKEEEKEKIDKNLVMLRDYFRNIPAGKALTVSTNTVYMEEGDKQLQIKADKFRMEILESAIEYVGIESADDLTIVGTLLFKDMLRDKVLKKVDLNAYKQPEQVLLDSIFVLSRDKKGGFLVEHIYQDPKIGGQRVSLHNFYITQEGLLEMRANFYNNMVSIEGGIQFRVYEFVIKMNEIVGKSNVFARLNEDEIKARKAEKKKRAEARENNKQVDDEKMQNNLALLL